MYDRATELTREDFTFFGNHVSMLQQTTYKGSSQTYRQVHGNQLTGRRKGRVSEMQAIMGIGSQDKHLFPVSLIADGFGVL